MTFSFEVKVTSRCILARTYGPRFGTGIPGIALVLAWPETSPHLCRDMDPIPSLVFQPETFPACIRRPLPTWTFDTHRAGTHSSFFERPIAWRAAK